MRFYEFSPPISGLPSPQELYERAQILVQKMIENGDLAKLTNDNINEYAKYYVNKYDTEEIK
jgi:hypothetical protein